ncbi:NAD(+) kinase [bacterium]|nr:NAD(+) kinase [bacterium]
MNSNQPKSIQSVAIFYNCQKPHAEGGAQYTQSFLREKGLHLFYHKLGEENAFFADTKQTILASLQQSDLVIVFGGDGTILGIAREMGAYPKPIMGVHVGRFGFLTSTTMQELDTALHNLIHGNYRAFERHLLEAWVTNHETETFRSFALNEALVTMSFPGRVLDIILDINDTPELAYRGDGLIIATPTGSTGHSLSAGGPILEPSLAALVITPLSPHSLFNRPLVVEGKKELCIHFREGTKSPELILDGQIYHKLNPTDRIYIQRSQTTIQTIVFGEHSFTNNLRQKFNLGQRIHE